MRSLMPFIVWLALSLNAAGDDVRPLLPNDKLPGNIATEQVPLGLGERPILDESPLTEGRASLGRRLFFDSILSRDRSLACASCHLPDHGFASKGRPRGIGGKQISRRAPTLFNRAFGTSFFWDGRETSLEAQVLRPIADPDEMGSSVQETLRRLEADKAYKTSFAAAFGDGVTAANLAQAIAAFERVLLRGNSAVDRFRHKGERSALSAAELHGLWLYESKGRCWRCHSGPNFSDEQYHNTGVSWGSVPADLGRFAVTKNASDRGKFKTPTLRGVALTGPFMHNGSIETLQDVVRFYNRGGQANPNLDPLLAPLELTETELRDLVAFLKAL
jgi:cytochrome c peroxidase